MLDSKRAKGHVANFCDPYKIDFTTKWKIPLIIATLSFQNVVLGINDSMERNKLPFQAILFCVPLALIIMVVPYAVL